MQKYLFMLMAMLLTLTACERNPQVNAQLGTPEYIAGEFFHAIYNEKDLHKAKSMATPEFANLLNSYGTARQAGRILFNMNFDNVTINVNRSGRNLREQYHNNANIQLILDGEFDGKRIQEVRNVILVKQRSSWLVSEVQADRFSSAVR
ncbi:hypothetical protein [Alishewanella jeotgali]|uniref:Lipoprotein n=1 Tax=Alishewanella jeotgali KCTC 22429 TaxID=1129374 RepID=H3ZIT6_9ALTE|nr:hypothetical protein [Alishewanella jeotgali]EHR39405.1 hypothetical protein AJE_16519 [Alishewanella jeotgali KCTC 22429]